MFKWNIKTRILFLSLVPTFTIALLLGIYFVSARISDLQRALEERGIAITENLAYASEYGVASGNAQVLQHLINTARDGDSDIISIAILDEGGHLFAYNGPQSALNKHRESNSLPSTTDVAIGDEYIIVQTPIIGQPIEISDVPNELNQFAIAGRTLGYISIQMSHKEATIRQYQTFTATFFIVLTGLFGSGYIAVRMVRDVTTPVIKMSRAVDQIREGRLDVRVEPVATGELQTLAEGINAMAESLREAREEMQQNIEQATSDLRQTLETIEVQNIELDIARKQALDGSRIKSEFMANMSHEIRTPLNGIIGFTDVLLKNAQNPQNIDYLTTIRKSATNLLTIINDILDFSKIEAGKMELDNAPLSLRDTLDEVLNILAPASHAKKLELVAMVYADVPDDLIGDALRIKQVLTNIVNNAIKFTKQGSVVVRIMMVGEENGLVNLCIRVTDTGIGISDKQKRNLFQAFSQADTSTTRKFGGTGLGLVISQKLVQGMKGEVGVESKLGEGSTFWFTVKLERASEQTPTELIPSKISSKDVLIIDQHPVTLLSLRQNIECFNVKISECASFDRVQHFLLDGSKDYGLFILGSRDYDEEATKLEKVMAEVRSQFPQVPLITLLNTNDNQIRQLMLDKGSSQCLVKPTTQKRLVESILNSLDSERPVTVVEATDDEALPSSHSESSYRQCHVMAVDDNDANLKLLTIFLQAFGLEVDQGSNGLEALRLAKKQEYSMIFMDIQMPEMDGITAMQAIRSNTINKDTPIIALTAHAMAGEKEKLLSAGMDDYLSKPITEQQISALLDKWVTQKAISDNFEKATKEQNDAANAAPASPAIPSQSSPTASPKPTYLNPAPDLVDLEQGLAQAGNRADVAQEMFDMLQNSLPDARKKIETALEIEEWEALQSAVHKLHGACCYCGVPKLKKQSNYVEDLLKQKDYELVPDEAGVLLMLIDKVENLKGQVKYI
ncbi:MAG: two-component sensor histidine kinase BarA [Kangiellaceae bacterium]|nr:two-component sensor histidine kinase BarA [Kangiellaceae bacterium]